MVSEKYYQGFDRYLRVILGLREKSVSSYLAKVKDLQNWLTANGVQDISSVTRREIEGYLEHCFYRSNANATRLVKLIALRKWFSYLEYEGVIKGNPTSNIPPPRIWRQFPMTLTKDEVLRLFSVIPHTEKGFRDFMVVICGVFLGLRISETINLTIGDVVEDEGHSLLFTIRNSKHYSHRTLKLWKIPSDSVRQWLVIRYTQGAKNSDPFIITYARGGQPTGKALCGTTIHFIIKSYAKQARIHKKIFFHTFRATHATTLRLISTYDLPAISARLGHRSVSTTADRYFASWAPVKKTYPSLAAYWKDFTQIVKPYLQPGKGCGNEKKHAVECARMRGKRRT